MRAARAPEGVSIDGRGPGDSGSRLSNDLPRSRRRTPSGKNPGGYTPGDGEFGLYAVHDPPEPGSAPAHRWKFGVCIGTFTIIP